MKSILTVIIRTPPVTYKKILGDMFYTILELENIGISLI